MDSALAIGQEVCESYLYVPPETAETAKDNIRRRMSIKALRVGVVLSNPTFEDVTPDDRRIAVFADGWPEGTRCVIGTATVIGDIHVSHRTIERGANFIADLDADALVGLRHVTREAAKVYGYTLTDRECDAVIAARGPEVAETVIKKISDHL